MNVCAKLRFGLSAAIALLFLGCVTQPIAPMRDPASGKHDVTEALGTAPVFEDETPIQAAALQIPEQNPVILDEPKIDTTIVTATPVDQNEPASPPGPPAATAKTAAETVAGTAFVPTEDYDRVTVFSKPVCGAGEVSTADQMNEEQILNLTKFSAAPLQRTSFVEDTRAQAQISFCPPPLSNANDRNYNYSGEKFLYFHHALWSHLQKHLAQTQSKCFTGWPELPLNNETQPQASEQLKKWTTALKDDDWLSSHSLSQLGWALEFAIYHNALPYYAGVAIGPDSDPNWLMDIHVAELNPKFWQLQGYIEHVTQAWLDAHSKTDIREACNDDTNCYQWNLYAPTVPLKQTAGAPDTFRDLAMSKFFELGHLSGSIQAQENERKVSSDFGTEDPFEFARDAVCSDSNL